MIYADTSEHAGRHAHTIFQLALSRRESAIETAITSFVVAAWLENENIVRLWRRDVSFTHTHTYTHTRTRTHWHARTHARTHRN